MMLRRRRRLPPRPEPEPCTYRGAQDEELLRCMFGPDHSESDRVLIKREEEFEYLERLGPETRKALTLKCKERWSALDVLKEIHRRGWDPMGTLADLKMDFLEHVQGRPAFLA